MTIERFGADGKVVEVWGQWDNLGFMQELGMEQQVAAQAAPDRPPGKWGSAVAEPHSLSAPQPVLAVGARRGRTAL